MEAPETNSNTAPDAEEAQPTLAGRTTELPHRDAPEEDQPSPEEDQATARRDPVSAEAPRPDAQDAPRLHDVTSTFGDYVRGRRDSIVAFAKGHRAATALLITLAVVAVATLAIAFAQAGRVPSGEHIAADARERLSAPTYSGGTFGHDDVLVARDVDVRRITRSGSASAGDNAQFGASGYASAEVVVSYTGSFVSANQGATLEYALLDGSWVDIGEASDVTVTWRASAGVDQEKVARNAHLLLERADEQGVPEGERPLAELYAGAAVEVSNESFDAEAQTDTLTLTCTRSETFYSYTCTMTVTFAFRQASGQWEVESVSVADGARERNLDPLLGTWAGTFQSQETDGEKCLAAREEGLEVVVSGASGGQISGTVSGVAHYHAHPSKDAADSEGDLVLENVPFSAKLVESEDGGLAFEAKLPEDVDGSATLTLSFGADGDPSAVTARLTSSYQHTGSILFFPLDETLTYTDLFSLAKAAPED